MWFSSLVLSRRPKILEKNIPKPSKIPSLLSAHAGIYIFWSIDILRTFFTGIYERRNNSVQGFHKTTLVAGKTFRMGGLVLVRGKR